MNINQILYDLTYWFDYSTNMVLHHPLMSVAAVVGAFLFHQALGAMKLTSFALGALIALFVGWLMF